MQIPNLVLDPPQIHGILRNTVNKREVRILLECILVTRFIPLISTGGGDPTRYRVAPRCPVLPRPTLPRRHGKRVRASDRPINARIQTHTHHTHTHQTHTTHTNISGGFKGTSGTCTPPRSKFFYFHAILGKFLQNNGLCASFGSRRPLGNPGSTTGYTQTNTQTHTHTHRSKIPREIWINRCAQSLRIFTDIIQ